MLLMTETESRFLEAENITERKNIRPLWLDFDILLQVQGCSCISMDAAFMQS